MMTASRLVLKIAIVLTWSFSIGCDDRQPNYGQWQDSNLTTYGELLASFSNHLTKNNDCSRASSKPTADRGFCVRSARIAANQELVEVLGEITDANPMVKTWENSKDIDDETYLRSLVEIYTIWLGLTKPPRLREGRHHQGEIQKAAESAGLDPDKRVVGKVLVRIASKIKGTRDFEIE